MIAIVEDEDTIREAVSFALRQQGHQVRGFADGLEAWTAFEAALPDLVILDIGLPRLDGLELCRRLRGRSEALPIIFVTSREEEFDRVLGLEIGADDYLCKPFSMRELLARIKVLLRRAALAAGANARDERDDRDRDRQRANNGGDGGDDDEERLLDAGSLRLDLQRYTATWKGRALALTVTEFLLLQALARHPGHVKTRDQLMQHAYPDNTFVSDRTIDSHVKRVRRKLEEVDPAFAAIETVYGLGYRFTADAPDAPDTSDASHASSDAAGTRGTKGSMGAAEGPDGQTR
jgi:two-component system, OmpR family, response regulator ChvI